MIAQGFPSAFPLVELKSERIPYDSGKIQAWDWTGVDIHKESQGPEKQSDSVQAKVIRELKPRPCRISLSARANELSPLCHPWRERSQKTLGRAGSAASRRVRWWEMPARNNFAARRIKLEANLSIAGYLTDPELVCGNPIAMKPVRSHLSPAGSSCRVQGRRPT